MAYTVSFGTSDKRINSTKIPKLGSTMACAFKTPCSMENPTITVQIDSIPASWNMFYIAELASYFWISDITAIGSGRYQISGTKDVLATYRADILNTKAYIEYGFNEDASESNYRLQDIRQNVSNTPTVSARSYNFLPDIISTTGTYLLTAVGKSGGVNMWKIFASDLQKILDTVNENIVQAVAQTSNLDDAFKYFTTNSLLQGTAVDAIRSCVWIPIDYTKVPSDGQVTTIFLGAFDTGVTGRRVPLGGLVTGAQDITIPWIHDDWRRMNSQVQLYIPFYGTVSVPIDQCNNAASVKVSFSVDCSTGNTAVKIDAGDTTIHTGTGNIASQYPIGINNVPVQQALSGIGNIATGVLKVGSGILTGSFAGVASGVASAAGNITQAVEQLIQPQIQCAGSLTGNASLGLPMTIKITCLYYSPIDDSGFSAVYGHPVMRVANLVSGYCKTRGFSAGGNAMLDDKARIAQYMDTGVFIE